MKNTFNEIDLFGKEIVEDKLFEESFNLYHGIINNIYFLLRKKGWKQKDLAKQLGKSESEISKWLDGFHNFKLETIAKIQIALGHDVLLTGKQIRPLIWKDEPNILKFVKTPSTQPRYNERNGSLTFSIGSAGKKGA